jgi:putative NIF3 family GTP cyclohydrolase 1 type 2
MTTLSDIIHHIETLSGHPLNKDEGVQHGDASIPVTGVTVCWMASPDVIDAAGRAGDQALICHESLYFPYDVVNSPEPPPDWKSWKVNRQRRERLETHGLTCVRIHGAADEICIFDVFAGLLGLGEPVVAEGLVKVYEIPECSLADLIRKVKQRMGMAAVRVADGGDLKRKVRRVGLPWGGLGLFVNVGYQQRLAELGCDVFIAGEADNYGFRFAAENGIPMIETSHELSETPGLRRFTELLAHAFPDVVFRFRENECVWRMA